MNLPIDTKTSSIVAITGHETIAFDPTKDIAVSVDYSFFPSTSTLGGGFCVFFIGDTLSQVISGTPGPGLGYTNVGGYNYNGITSFPGVYGSYVGVGFDVDGWFSLSGAGISGGYATPQPNSICVRGGQLDNYSLIGNSGNLLNYPNGSYPNSKAITLSCVQDEYKTLRVSLLNFSSTILVEFKNDIGEFVPYYQCNFSLPKPLLNIRPGLTYSTGVSGNSNFWIKGINFRGCQGKIPSIIYPLQPLSAQSITPNIINITLSETNDALSAYGLLNGYLFYIIDPTTFEFTSYYYSNTAMGLSSYTASSSALPIIEGGTFNDYSAGYFNYRRNYSIVNQPLISELDTVYFNLSGIADDVYNIIKITLDKYGDNTELISSVKDCYLTYKDTGAITVIDETNEYNSPKYTILEAKYQTLSTDFTTTYTPILSVFRDNGVIDVITVTLTVAKKSFQQITQEYRIIDTYQFNDKIIIKMQNPVNNQIYFTSLSAG